MDELRVLGDRIVNTVTALLSAAELVAIRDGLALSVAKISRVELSAHLVAMLSSSMPDPVELAAIVRNKATEKYDVLLPDELLDVTYAARSLDVPGAWKALHRVIESTVAGDGGER
jgi:ATP-dependent Lhr-like helicase